MSTALYRRYRPQTFADVIGQEHVTEPLMQALRTGRVGHAYLFSGPRGCGKTTSARILARCLNCEQGPTPEPCGQCPSCVALATGGPGSVDVIEIDAASHGGVDDARDLREKAAYGPAHSRFKVYIIDEAHMVTPQGFNALLKIVEEPPEHVKFVFATTEPEKVIGTIRSRTHHYPFRLVPPARLAGYLEALCGREDVAVEPGVLSFVVRAGGGSVRDSLSVLDQLIAGSGSEGLTYAGAAALLGFTESELLDAVVDALAAGDGGAVFRQLDKVIETGHDPRRFVEDLLERFRDLIIVAASEDAAAAVLRGVPEDQLQRMRQQAASFGPGELSRSADIVNAGLTELSGATSPRLQLELICARLLLPAASGAGGYAARLDRLERRLDMAGPTPPPARAGGQSEAPRGEAWSDDRADGAEPWAAIDRVGPADVPQRGGREALRQAHAAAREDPSGAPAARTDARSDTADAGQRATGAPRSSEHGAPRQAQREAARERPGPPADAGAGCRPARPAVASAGAGGAGSGDPAGPAGGNGRPRPPEAQGRPGAPAPGGTPRGGLDTDAVRRSWPDVLAKVFAIRRVTWTFLSEHAQVLEYDGRRLVLGIATEGLARTFHHGPHAEVVRQALIETLGVDAQVEGRIMPGRGAEPGPRTSDGPGADEPPPEWEHPESTAWQPPPERPRPEAPREAPPPSREAPPASRETPPASGGSGPAAPSAHAAPSAPGAPSAPAVVPAPGDSSALESTAGPGAKAGPTPLDALDDDAAEELLEDDTAELSAPLGVDDDTVRAAGLDAPATSDEDDDAPTTDVSHVGEALDGREDPRAEAARARRVDSVGVPLGDAPVDSGPPDAGTTWPDDGWPPEDRWSSGEEAPVDEWAPVGGPRGATLEGLEDLAPPQAPAEASAQAPVDAAPPAGAGAPPRGASSPPSASSAPPAVPDEATERPAANRAGGRARMSAYERAKAALHDGGRDGGNGAGGDGGVVAGQPGRRSGPASSGGAGRRTRGADVAAAAGDPDAEVSEDDEVIDDLRAVGQPVIAKVLGGVVIHEETD